MRVYYDTGIFVDYLSARGHIAAGLRIASRRGRTPEQLAHDAEKVLKKVAESHKSATSSLTYYEAEESILKSILSAMKGVPNAQKLMIPVARSFAMQCEIVIGLFGITVLNLDHGRVQAALGNLTLQTSGIRSADSFHIATAAAFDADLLVTTDEGVALLDRKISNKNGVLMRICDTDPALALL